MNDHSKSRLLSVASGLLNAAVAVYMAVGGALGVAVIAILGAGFAAAAGAGAAAGAVTGAVLAAGALAATAVACHVSPRKSAIGADGVNVDKPIILSVLAGGMMMAAGICLAADQQASPKLPEKAVLVKSFAGVSGKTAVEQGVQRAVPARQMAARL